VADEGPTILENETASWDLPTRRKGSGCLDLLGQCAGPGGCVVGILFIVALLFPSFMSARHKAHDTACVSNEKQICRALIEYSQDYDETLPPESRWADLASLHLLPAKKQEVFHCLEAKTPFSYVFNVHLDRAQMSEIDYPSETVMIYEGPAFQINAADDGKAIPVAIRHNVEGANFGYADGHVKLRIAPKFGDPRWDKTSSEGNRPQATSQQPPPVIYRAVGTGW